MWKKLTKFDVQFFAASKVEIFFIILLLASLKIVFGNGFQI